MFRKIMVIVIFMAVCCATVGPASTRVQASAGNCVPGFPSRLAPGMIGEIEGSHSTSNLLRPNPSAATNQSLASIRNGERFLVIGGPVCDEANGALFVQVRFNRNNQIITGWTSETRRDYGYYFINPVTPKPDPEACEAPFEALHNAASWCYLTPVNQICYGSPSLQYSPSNMRFSEQNRFVDLYQFDTLTTVPETGVALLRVAGIGGGTVSLIAFGTTTFTNWAGKLNVAVDAYNQCGSPASAVIAQTKPGQTATIILNDVEIRLGSTALIWMENRSGGGAMKIAHLDGTVAVTALAPSGAGRLTITLSSLDEVAVDIQTNRFLLGAASPSRVAAVHSKSFPFIHDWTVRPTSID